MTVLVRAAAFGSLLLLGGWFPVAAQNPPLAAGDTTTHRGEIHGRVVDAANQTPIGVATVEVMDSAPAAAAAPTARTYTGSDGGFRVQGLRPGRYRVRIRAIGYAPRELPPVGIGAAAPIMNLGTVALTPSPVELQSLEVTAPEQEVQLAPDRNTYVVRDMPTTKGGTVLDVLRNVPSVDVDIENVVSLRGNSGVVVQLNGRPSPMKDAQLGNFLAQLPAAMVEKVEVITNPSARENPEGVAGIINIVLKRKADTGTSGGLTLGGGTTGHVDVGGHLGFQRGPLSFYGSYGFLRDNRPRRDSLSRDNLYLNPVTYLEERGQRSQIPLAHTVTGTATYQAGRRDELSLEGLYTRRTEDESYGILYRDLNAAHDLTGLSDRLTRDTNHEYNFESALGYKHRFGEEGHELSGELRVVRDGEGGPRRVVARTLALDGTPVGAPARESQAGWEYPAEYSLKVDYTRPVSSRVRLETGYQGSLAHLHTTLETQVLDTTQSIYLPDSTRISDFTYRQFVHAAYGVLEWQLGKFVLQGGVRAEHAATRFDLTTHSARYDNRYNSLFPSALLAYNFDESHQVKLSYSTRIRRPDDTDLLDPTLRALDPLNVSRGDPYLKPEYIRAFELGLQRTTARMTIQVTPFFRRTVDAVRTLRSIDSAGVTTRSFANVATSDAYGADGTLALRGGRLTGFLSASAFRQVSDASNLGSGLSARTYGWSARTNASFRVTRTLDLQTLLSYQAPMTVEQGRIASRTRLSLAARRKLLNDRMSVTLRVLDPFNTSRERSTTIDPQFTQVSSRRRAIRGLLLSVSWTFGKPPNDEGREPHDQGGGDAGPP